MQEHTNFDSEAEFEKYIRSLIVEHILPIDKNLVLFKNKKAVDILLCRNGIDPALYFIEVKYHKHNHGRLGTGHTKGDGFQPEILDKQPTYFENNMRWILGVKDIEGFYFLKNSEISKYIAGGAIGIKHNNIQVKLFRQQVCLTEESLIKNLKKWILR